MAGKFALHCFYNFALFGAILQSGGLLALLALFGACEYMIQFNVSFLLLLKTFPCHFSTEPMLQKDCTDHVLCTDKRISVGVSQDVKFIWLI